MNSRACTWFAWPLLVALVLSVVFGYGIFASAEPFPPLQAAVAQSSSESPQASSLDGAGQAPPSARQQEIPTKAQDLLQAIQNRGGEPLPGYVGGRTFRNREQRLPRGDYREYDVHPKRPGRTRGAERIVIEGGTGKAYYTADHYRTFLPMN